MRPVPDRSLISGALPKNIKLTIGNLILPKVSHLNQELYPTPNPDVSFMPRIFHEYKEEVKKKIVEAAYGHFLRKGYMVQP